MTSDQLSAIRARLAAATPGPWHTGNTTMYGEDESRIAVDGPNMENAVCLVTDDWTCQQANAEFIASARTDVETLLQEVERLQDECDTWEEDSKIIGDVAANSERVELEIIALRAENARLRADLSSETARANDHFERSRDSWLKCDAIKAQLASMTVLAGKYDDANDELRAQLARAVELLKNEAGLSALTWGVQVMDFLASIRTTEGGTDGKA